MIDRVVKGENAVTLDKLDVIANACRMPVWELLRPEFTPSASPHLQMTAEDIAFLQKLRRFIDSR